MARAEITNTRGVVVKSPSVSPEGLGLHFCELSTGLAGVF